MNFETDLNLIVTVMKKGRGELALNASLDAGAKGGTILYGRGVGIHNRKMLLGMRIEPEKEVLLTVVKSDIEDVVLMAIAEALDFNKPGSGFSMVVPVNKAIGRMHMFANAVTESDNPPPKDDEPSPQNGDGAEAGES